MISAQAVEPLLVDFNCRIEFTSRRQVEVTAAARVEGLESADVLAHSLIAYDGQQIRDLRVTAEGVELADLDVRRRPRLLGFDFSASTLLASSNVGSTYTIEYKVDIAAKGPPRIPLPVPALRTPLGERAVHISLTLPEGEVPVGDSFPVLAWRDSGRGYADLANVPSFVKVVTKPAGSISFADRVAAPSVLNDAAIILLIAIGSVIWRVKYNKKLNTGNR